MVFQAYGDCLKKAEALFGNYEDTMIRSCFQQIMGSVFIEDDCRPEAAAAVLGCFRFFAGKPSAELLRMNLDGFAILTPQNERWSGEIEKCFGDRCVRRTRYALKKDTVFDRTSLVRMSETLPEGYSLKMIDSGLYDQCMEHPWSRDFVSNFESKDSFLSDGIGVVAVRDGTIAAGASSFSRYREGIEVEVDTRKDCRRMNLATACSAKLILECLARGLYPGWDAQNIVSLHLAEKLGYVFSHEYPVYEIDVENTAID